MQNISSVNDGTHATLQDLSHGQKIKNFICRFEEKASERWIIWKKIKSDF